MKRIQKYVSDATGHQFSTKKLTIDLLRKTYLNRMEQLGLSDLRQQQAQNPKFRLFQTMKIGKFHFISARKKIVS